MSAQGWSLRQPWDRSDIQGKTLKGFVLKANHFRIRTPLDVMVPKVLAISNLGLKSANTFSVFRIEPSIKEISLTLIVDGPSLTAVTPFNWSP